MEKTKAIRWICNTWLCIGIALGVVSTVDPFDFWLWLITIVCLSVLGAVIQNAIVEASKLDEAPINWNITVMENPE